MPGPVDPGRNPKGAAAVPPASSVSKAGGAAIPILSVNNVEVVYGWKYALHHALAASSSASTLAEMSEKHSRSGWGTDGIRRRDFSGPGSLLGSILSQRDGLRRGEAMARCATRVRALLARVMRRDPGELALVSR